jgi:hypothetical protein
MKGHARSHKKQARSSAAPHVRKINSTSKIDSLSSDYFTPAEARTSATPQTVHAARQPSRHAVRSRPYLRPFSGITRHAPITFCDQHAAQMRSGNTTNSTRSWHRGHSRAGDRNSTSLAALVMWINCNTEMARSMVFRGHGPYTLVVLTKHSWLDVGTIDKERGTDGNDNER